VLYRSFVGLPDAVAPLADSWTLHLRALNRSPRTIKNYRWSLEHFCNWCEANGRPLDPRLQKPADVTAWIADQLDSDRPNSALTRYRCLQQWFRWLVEEEEIDASPMQRTRPPAVAEVPPPVLSDAAVLALLNDAKGTYWMDRRDTAIIRLLLDTGMRVSELVGITLADLDLVTSTVLVTGKGRRERIVPIGTKAGQAIDRYMRARARRPHADFASLWLSKRGRMTDEAVRAMLRVRGQRAGIGHVYPHLFRHTAAHNWLVLGGQERDLMSIAGWRSSDMLARYGASAAAERAREAHKRLGPGDRL
jgi:site-specific recombinase XerD